MKFDKNNQFLSAFFLVLKQTLECAVATETHWTQSPKKHVFEFGRESLFLEADN